MTALLFYAVAPTFLIILSLTIGLISGVCITLLIHNLINIIKIKKVGKWKINFRHETKILLNKFVSSNKDLPFFSH